jgi:hypothetical protein
MILAGSSCRFPLLYNSDPHCFVLISEGRGEYRALEMAENITELPRCSGERAPILLTLALDVGERSCLYLRFTHWKTALVTYLTGGYVDTIAVLNAAVKPGTAHAYVPHQGIPPPTQTRPTFLKLRHNNMRFPQTVTTVAITLLHIMLKLLPYSHDVEKR